MLSQEADDALSLLEAKIQSRIAKFLTLKEILYKLSLHSNPDIANRAKVLMAVQNQLQTNLTQALTDIETLKKTGWSVTGLATLGTFYYLMDKQISDVGKLQTDAGTAPLIAAAIPSWLVPTALAGILLIIFLGRR